MIKPKILTPTPQKKIPAILKKALWLNVFLYIGWTCLKVIFVLFGKTAADYNKVVSFWELNHKKILGRSWTLCSYAFVYSYGDFFFVLSLLLLLYQFGSLVIDWFGRRHFIVLYCSSILSAGALFTLLAQVLPFFKHRDTHLYTPYVCICSFVAACAAYRPNTYRSLFFFPVRIKFIAGLFLLFSLVNIGAHIDPRNDVYIDFYVASLWAFCYGALYGFMFKLHKAKKKKVTSLTDIEAIWRKMERTGYHSLTPQEQKKLLGQKTD